MPENETAPGVNAEDHSRTPRTSLIGEPSITDRGPIPMRHGQFLGITDADMTRVVVVPESDPTRAKDLLDALRGAGESGGVVLVGGWDAHESAQWEDLTDAKDALLVFRGNPGTGSS